MSVRNSLCDALNHKVPAYRSRGESAAISRLALIAGCIQLNKKQPKAYPHSRPQPDACLCQPKF
jgi:hypothetical protein